MRYTCIQALVLITVLTACGGDDEVCDPSAQSGCEDGLVCEVVTGGDPACFEPVVVRGNVFDLGEGFGVEGARVVALDINNAPVSSVAVTDASGDYALGIPSARDENGEPHALELTLRADAAGYQSFPSGLRQALPVDTGTAQAVDGEGWVVESALTDIGLLSLPGDAGAGAIFGAVELPDGGVGVLVVAVDGQGVGHAAIADRDGDYRIFNLAAGEHTVTAYARGVSYASAVAQVAGDTEVDLALSGEPTGTVTGQIQIVNAPGGSVTSVILAVESTFDEGLARGAVPPGMRAPEPGMAPDVAGVYTIDGVPAGRYVVLAAFENDSLVRDPDLSIGGTSLLHIEVAAGGTTTVDGFKITEALEVLGPGADGPEEVTGAPVLTWEDDSSEDSYDVVVLDAFGEVVWDTSIAGVSGGTPQVAYEGPALAPGMYYQFRATSVKDGTPISRTEDLKGVFYAP